MIDVVRLVGALAYKRWILLKRYPVDTFGQLVTVAVVFLVLFVGGRALVGPALGDSLDAIVVGYFLWTMAVGAYASLAQTITSEARLGTLEQLYVLPRGFVTVAAAMAVVFLVETFVWGSAMLAFMLVLTGVSLHVHAVTVVIVGATALCSAIGVGFLMGGLALLYKRVTSLLGLLQFAFVAFIAAPVGRYPIFHTLPMATGTHLLRLTMENGATLWDLPADLLGILFVKAAVFVALGAVSLGRIVDVARRRGVVGQY